MARPRKPLFFEQPIPNYLSHLNWLPDYSRNCKEVIDYLITNGVKDTIYYATIRCFDELKAHLTLSNVAYTPDIANTWFDAITTHPKGYLTSLYRLEDIYIYGKVQPENAFPICYPNYDKLNDEWKNLLDDYIKTLDYTPSYKKDIRNRIARFFFKLQNQGIINASDITYDVLKAYIDQDGHRSIGTGAEYTYSIGDILHYMYSIGLCSLGLGWYPYFRMHGLAITTDHFLINQKNFLSKMNQDKQSLSVAQYYNHVSEFLEKFDFFDYKDTSTTLARLTLYNLLLFLDMYELAYCPEIAKIWLNIQSIHYIGGAWKGMRRILNLFALFVDSGEVHPQVHFYEKPLLSELLPDWCIYELNAFLKQKEKEGWADSTICMYRSAVTRFCRFLADSHMTEFGCITAEVIKRFNKQDQHLTVEGKNSYNVRIRKFLQFLERKNILPYGIHLAMMCIAAPKEKVIAIFSDKELSEIAEKRVKAISKIEMRSHAILLLGIKMGLRASDIVGIRFEDIDWERNTIRIMQKKTKYEILLPMPTDVGNAIYIYIKNGRPKTKSNFIFVSSKIPYDSAQRGICLYSLKSVLPNRNVPLSGFHVTRKTFATNSLRASISKNTIADMLGHKDTSSLSHYLNLDSENMTKCPLSLSEIGLEVKGGRYD